MDRIDDVLRGQWSWIDAHPGFKAVIPVAATLYRLPAEDGPLTVHEIATATGVHEHAAADALTRYPGVTVDADGVIDTPTRAAGSPFPGPHARHRPPRRGPWLRHRRPDAARPDRSPRPRRRDLPRHRRPVTIETDAGGTATANPAGAVVTIMMAGDVGDIRGSICAPGQIFTSERAARAWPEPPPSVAVVSAAVWESLPPEMLTSTRSYLCRSGTTTLGRGRARGLPCPAAG